MKKFPKKILLLSNVPPCNNYSGGQVLEQLCRFIPKGSLVCFAVMEKFLHPKISPDLYWIPIEYFYFTPATYPRMPWGIGGLISFISETNLAIFLRKKVIAEIVKFGKKHRVEALWVTLQGQTIRLALPAAKALGVPLFSEIWDVPDWWLEEHRIDQWSAKLFLKQFVKTLKTSRSCAVAGPAMAKEYHERYQVTTVPFLPSLPVAWAKKIGDQIHSKNELIIGVAGQLYSIKEWHSLIEALNIIKWKIGNRSIKIRLVGNYTCLDAQGEMQIEFLGYRSQKDTVKLMSEADILYCPYFFNPEYENVSRFSFPGKITTYLAAGRPIFFHGPEYASPGIFLEENKTGIFCKSLEPKTIIKMLTQLTKNQKLYRELAKNGRNIFNRFFTFRLLHQSLAQFLQVDEKDLLPYEKN